MPQREDSKRTGPLSRAAQAVRNFFHRDREEAPAFVERQSIETKQAEPQTARPTRRATDIPLDVLDRTYTPPVTSSKTSFRSDGSDHQRDQELVEGSVNERWNDEDRYTNKSGDPRIGTRGRTYEPGEERLESHD